MSIHRAAGGDRLCLPLARSPGGARPSRAGAAPSSDRPAARQRRGAVPRRHAAAVERPHVADIIGPRRPTTRYCLLPSGDRRHCNEIVSSSPVGQDGQFMRGVGATVVTETVNLYDAKTNLSKLVERAAAGEEIVIAKAGKPKAKLVPYQPPRKKRRFGQNLLGISYIAEDFDGPLPPELQKYFE